MCRSMSTSVHILSHPPPSKGLDFRLYTVGIRFTKYKNISVLVL